MTFTLADIPTLHPNRPAVPRTGYRLWKLTPVFVSHLPGVGRLLANVEFDFFPSEGPDAGKCLNIRARLMHDDEHGDTWLGDAGVWVPGLGIVKVRIPGVIADAVCGEFLFALEQQGVAA